MDPPRGQRLPTSLVHGVRTVCFDTVSTGLTLNMLSADSGLARFLKTQPDLRDLSLYSGSIQSSFKLASDALPLLDSFRTFYASSTLLSEVT